MKCDSKEQAVIANFEPESPYVVVCEGFQDLGLICSLLKHLRIDNCDVTYPKKVDGGNGKEAICKVINLLAGRPTVRGILVVADADGHPADSFKTICGGLAPFPVPKKPFVVEKIKDRRSGVFLIPGDGKTGALEHLLLEIVRAENPDLVTCVEGYRTCTAGAKAWSDNDDAKMKMQCIVAATCEKNPYCSLAWIWGYATVPAKIDSPILKELSEFLTTFSS